MKTIGNLIWLCFCGIWSALGWLITAGFLAITVVGLPFARQCLKLARFTWWPFGRTTIKSPAANVMGPVGNILWFIPGIFLALVYAFAGIAMCITVIGIPFGMQAFKFIPLALSPFGKQVVRSKDLTTAMGAPAAV